MSDVDLVELLCDLVVERLNHLDVLCIDSSLVFSQSVEEVTRNS